MTLPDATPSEAEAKRLLAAAGITVGAGSRPAPAPSEAVAAAELFGFPVVMKILSPDILHKSEIGGVLLDVVDDAAVRDGYDLLLGARQARRAGRAHRGRAGGEAVARAAWSASWASTATRCSARSRCSGWAASSSR